LRNPALSPRRRKKITGAILRLHSGGENKKAQLYPPAESMSIGTRGKAA
jgi:hypothetical protein